MTRSISAVGRFLQPDSVVPDPSAGSGQGPADPQSLNRYSYVLNNPLRYTDPSGRYHSGTEQCLLHIGCDDSGGVECEGFGCAVRPQTEGGSSDRFQAAAVLLPVTTPSRPSNTEDGGFCNSLLGFTCAAGGAIRDEIGDILEGLGDCSVKKVAGGFTLVTTGGSLIGASVVLEVTVVGSEIAAAPETGGVSLLLVPHTAFAAAGPGIAGAFLVQEGYQNYFEAGCFSDSR